MKLDELFYPEGYCCLVCDRDIFNNPYVICDRCFKRLPFTNSRVCLHCGDLLVSDGDYCKRCKGKKFIYERAIAPFLYKDDISTLIFGLKYDNKKYIAKSLAKFMADCYLHNKFYADVIIPVPLCNKRMKQRGYNQSELLATEISKILDIPINLDCLKRVKETPTQTKLDYIDRQNNMVDAFKVYNSKNIKDKVVLIIDDVFTTGATVTECSKTLTNAGAKMVYVLTCAHTVLKKDKEKKK